MRFVAEPAFVLHARAWRETSLLVEVLSAEHGRIGLVARGVQGPKRHVLRAALQPLQSIRFDAVQRGELAQLTAAEAVDAAPLLHGDAAMAAFYINELCLRLAPRHDPQAELHAVYARVRECLRAGAPLAWTLRRFERDLLEALGFGFDFGSDVDGVPVDPAARYRLDPEQGPYRVLSERTGERRDSATGQALLALADDTLPPSDDIASLRLPLRAVLLHHLGGRGLKSWDMMGELGRLGRRGEAGRETGSE
ncbi:DNA repair protein RecO [Thermomonas sp. HDW16]|uniref:DNA repair protein RecO n=1 Tax=Thermomonas sp. HDW16 TaxID=2714945 RepID=UPI00140C6378|nr:DNA repair protein RecO [Thermomonas sp. HDW16]QIL20979.1 DNA repair protein RecO [Thermomonas sp. HDW16]